MFNVRCSPWSASHCPSSILLLLLLLPFAGSALLPAAAGNTCHVGSQLDLFPKEFKEGVFPLEPVAKPGETDPV